MFRAQQSNPFDEPVGKATDENLTQENWALIIEVCDKVEQEENGGKDAVAAMIKRLAHRNANVQLYTLELANALSQNCGIKIHKELASRSFTDALLRLAADRNTHTQVKTRILERMTEWAEMFSSNPDLGIMEQAYSRLKSQNPSLQPPSKPFKQEITDIDRQKEEEELQMALALSIKDKPGQSSSGKKPAAASSAAASSSQQAPAQPASQGTTAATVSRVRALFDFQPSEPGELQFRKGDIIAVLESVYKDWWKGSLRGNTGIFPLNYVQKLQDPTADDLEREAQMEAEVFGEIKNVEKLLTLLSTSSADANVRDNEEITSLYQQTVAIRPKLIELIGKYSQKKDDMTQLNEKFIKARRDYEALLEQSMSHQPSHGMYGRPPPGPSYGGYGAPPRQEPQRYYTPGPQSQQPDGYPPRDGPTPFYMIPPGQQPPPQGQQPLPQHTQYQPQPDYQQPSSPPTTYQNPSMPPPSHPQQHYPQPPIAELGRASLYSQNPQELATTDYDPTHSQYPPASQPSSHDPSYSSQYSTQHPSRSSSHYSDGDDLYSAPGQQQQQQNSYEYNYAPSQQQQQQQQQGYPPQPSQPPPGPPSMTGSPPPMHPNANVDANLNGYGGNTDIPAPLQLHHRQGQGQGQAPQVYPQPSQGFGGAGGGAGGYQPYKPPGVRSGGNDDDGEGFYR